MYTNTILDDRLITKEYILKLTEIQSVLDNEFDINTVQSKISKILNIPIHKVWVKGTILERIILAKISDGMLAISNKELKENHNFFYTYKELLKNIKILDKNFVYFEINNNKEFESRLDRPNIKLISLFHKNTFPFPRFPLGISDIAGAVRSKYKGQISLADMQLDESLEDILDDIKISKYDIIGISATFGQYDLLEQLLDLLNQKLLDVPLIIIGGSLSALNFKQILEKYPYVLIGLGYGETTMQNLIDYWNGEIHIDQINDIAFYDNNQKSIKTTHKRKDDKYTYIVPELDLLEKTLNLGGVMQLESSRGCTYHCSFCPRSHKGKWSGDTAQELKNILPYVISSFSKYPNLSKKIFLLDEEFIGYSSNNKETEARALGVATIIHEAGFKFESSTRIDQVSRPRQNRDWHVNRIHFWKSIKKKGLSRMLFGLESGVESILKRFNKQTTLRQNIQAIRTLTSLSIPIRITYITFDPLMSMEELISSFYFQGRKDILLKPSKDLRAEQLLDNLENDDYIQNESIGRALYSEISYMLVSMESLIGSEYLRLVEEAGLAGEISLSMGRRQTRYKNEEIGIISELSQQWVDRNFALDYALKSMMKISDRKTSIRIKYLREIIKDYSYILLAKMLSLSNNNIEFLQSTGFEANLQMNLAIKKYLKSTTLSVKKQIINEVMNEHFEELKNKLIKSFKEIDKIVPKHQCSKLQNEFDKWISSNKWFLINN